MVLVFWKGKSHGSVKGLCNCTGRPFQHSIYLVTVHANHMWIMLEFQVLFSSSGEVRSVTNMLLNNANAADSIIFQDMLSY